MAKEIRGLEQPPGDADAQRFVASIRPLERSLARLVKASRTMKPARLTPATRRFATALTALRKAARQSGLNCVQRGGVNAAIGAMRAPIAAERLAAIERRVLARIKAADNASGTTGYQNAIAALEDEDAALRALEVPHWALTERAAFRRGCRGYREGLAEAIDRYNAGLATSHEQYLALVKRPAQKCDRLMNQLWKAIGARPVHGLK